MYGVLMRSRSVPVTIKGGPAEVEVKSLPKHKKNPEVGEKNTVYSSQIYLEQEDALSFDDQEEVRLLHLLHSSSVSHMSCQITLMDWGNAIVRSKTANESGTVTAIELDLHLEGDFRKTKKKITWLPQAAAGEHSLIEVTLLDHDYLITKKKLEENDDVQDFVTPQSEFREDALADANVRALKKGDIIQFERKGYYIFDGAAGGGRHEFIHIPDGRAASIASKAGAQTGTATPAEGGGAGKKAKESKKGAGAAKSAAVPADAAPATRKAAFETPAETTMYKVKKVYGAEDEEGVAAVETKMYKVKSVYDP